MKQLKEVDPYVGALLFLVVEGPVAVAVGGVGVVFVHRVRFIKSK
jgi:hypothetical protein